MKSNFSYFQEEAERSALERIQQVLMDGKPARSVALTDLEQDAIKHLCLLTMKPIIYVANVAESDVANAEDNTYVKEVAKLASELESAVVTVSAQVKFLFCSNCYTFCYILDGTQQIVRFQILVLPPASFPPLTEGLMFFMSIYFKKEIGFPVKLKLFMFNLLSILTCLDMAG